MFVADINNQPEVTPFVPAPMRDLDSAEASLEVVVMWGEQSVLHVAHLSPPRAFYVGSGASGPDAVDFVLHLQGLGEERMPITLQEGDQSFAVIPNGATGYVTHGEQMLSFAELAELGGVTPCSSVPGAGCIRLEREMSARIEYLGFCFLVRPTLAARRIGVASVAALDWSASRFTFGSVLLHLSLLVLFYFAPPRSTVLAIDRLGADSRLVDYLVTPDETFEPPPEWSEPGERAEPSGGDSGQAAPGDEGRAGKQRAPKNKRGAVNAGRETDPVGVARAMAQDLITSDSIIGVLRGAAGEPGELTSVYGRENAEANNAVAVGVDDGFGNGAPGMIGTGHGGGGHVIGAIGVGGIGTLGVGGRGRDGLRYGVGGGVFRDHPTIMPDFRHIEVSQNGALSKEVIRRAVQLHLSEVRFCYQQALQARPELQGRVAVKFVIGRSGTVALAMRAESSLNEHGVESCIVDAVKRWTFPPPDGGGIVTVTYPFVLQQAGD